MGANISKLESNGHGESGEIVLPMVLQLLAVRMAAAADFSEGGGAPGCGSSGACGVLGDEGQKQIDEAACGTP